ncbi:MAG: hypothetical protein Q4D61_09425 [Cardiobacteriaceae bacterium]|nr:hypothetical protein [Cardiobacteriaceae bacterium]
MKQKSSPQATPAPRKKRPLPYNSALPVANILRDLFAKGLLPERNPNHMRYHNLLMQAIPEQWHAQVRPGKLEYRGWEIFALDSAIAYRLKFFIPEIERRLAEHLPHVPPIIVKVDPAMKTAYSFHPPKSLPAPRERLSDHEAKDILAAFFAKHRKR